MNSIYIAISIVAMLSIIIISIPTSQGIEVPEFNPRGSVSMDNQDNQSSTTSQNTVKEPSEEIAMKVQLEEHSNEFLAFNGYYEVSDFAFVASNSSKLCSVGTCEYELEDGQMPQEFTSGERSLDGKFKVGTGESKKVMNMRANWETIEERQTADGETIFVIEGDLGIGRDEFRPEHKYQINGTLTPDDNEYVLEVTGRK